LEGFNHFDDVRAEVLIDGGEGIGVRRAVAIDRSPEEMAGGIGHKELAGRGCVSLQIEEYSIDVRLRMGVVLFGYSGSEGGVAIDKLQGIVGEFAQIVMHRLVRTMDCGVQGRVIKVDPVAFVLFLLGLDDGVSGDRKGVRVIEN